MFDLQAIQQENNTNAAGIDARRSDQTTSKHTLKQDFSWHSAYVYNVQPTFLIVLNKLHGFSFKVFEAPV
jgi:hypothetical protein